MNVVIYARFSSHSQTEQSIEGQLKVCYEYAKQYDFTVVGEYIDRAISGTTDNRPQFRKMIEDSAKHQFDGVLVYQLDRFARNRYDSATNKAKLKKNGVRVISAKENITDDASGVLMEAVLEGMAEYYSAELSQKVRRGMAINAEKCLSTGRLPPFGYKVVDKKYVIDSEKAPYVKKIFEMYAEGCQMKIIAEYLNARQIMTTAGKPFGRTSLYPILSNKRYTGYYIFQGVEVKDGMPRIISDELYQEAQRKLVANKRAPARSKAKEEYILTTKLFCGECKEPMVGYSGTSRNGDIYNYYICMGRKNKSCHKEYVSKCAIEDYVIKQCRSYLTDTVITTIVDQLNNYMESINNDAELKHLQKLLNDNHRKTNNLLSAISECDNELARKALYTQLPILSQQQQNIEQQIAIEQIKMPSFDKDAIIFFLMSLRDGDINSKKYRKLLISVLVNRIYLYDNRTTIYFNTDKNPCEISQEIISDVESADCSYLVGSGQPTNNRLESYSRRLFVFYVHT